MGVCIVDALDCSLVTILVTMLWFNLRSWQAYSYISLSAISSYS